MTESSPRRVGPTGQHADTVGLSLESLPVAALICNREGFITHFNRQAELLWGQAPKLNNPTDRYCGSLRFYSVAGEPIAPEECWMSQTLKSGQPFSDHEVVIERPDGSRTQLSIHANPLYDSSGDIVGAMNVLINMADHRRADEAQWLLAAIVESSDDAIVSKTLQGIITSWNTGAQKLFGYSAQEAVGRPATLVIPNDRLNEEHEILDRVRQGKPVAHSETVRVAKDGRKIHASVAVSPVRDPAGRVIGASSVTRDISARKAAEAALVASQERFRTMADNIAQLVWVMDASGMATWYNQRWFEYTGSTAEDLQGRGWQDALDPRHFQRVTDKFKECIAAAAVWEDTFPLRGTDGTYRWFLSRAIPICDDAGNVLRWFGTNTDVTAQLEAEEALRAADQRKDEFLAMLAHELRNPLAPIANSLHILRLVEELDPAVEKVRQIMERQTNHMVRLVDDLLEVSRAAQGKIELRSEVVELAAVVRSAVETSRPMVDAKQHNLAVSMPPEPISVWADPTRLAQVFANLLNNAARYTADGGQISLTVGVEDGEVAIRVKDNGIGISREMLPRVFDKFTQAVAVDGNVKGGLGIGLTLAEHLVSLHDGTIEAFSDGLDRGSEFVVRLPLSVRTQPPSRMVESSATDTFAQQHVFLIVDDARDSVFILSKLLEKLGQKVWAADCAEKALVLARVNRPDVVISDIAMAGTDGCELARQLRDDPDLQSTLLVALTGYGQDIDRQRTKEAGFDHHLVKPVSLETLEWLIGSLRSSRQSAG